ncbi:MAG TPA: hypothetical protein VMX94_00755 [Armatimonadota bacterium]|nr:hypothetical protein [Armatimonadota bacterium]
MSKSSLQTAIIVLLVVATTSCSWAQFTPVETGIVGVRNVAPAWGD